VFWGDDCVAHLLAYLEQCEPLLIYAHNGGKFDFHFLLKHVENPLRVIKQRIVSAKLMQHQLRDSYAILPVALKTTGKKLDIDINLLERERREKNRHEIERYLHADCVALFDMVASFRERFGDALTIGSVALKELSRLHPFRRQGSGHDAVFRPWYFGGRVQCFAPAGVYEGDWRVYDVNSMYPYVMRTMRHGINGSWELDTLPDDEETPYFALIDATSKRALVRRTDDKRLVGDHERALFFASGHEIRAGFACGRLDIHDVLDCYVARDHLAFDAFVDLHYAAKDAAKREGNKIDETFAKLLLNSAYGATAKRPDLFREYYINHDLGKLPEAGWSLSVDLQSCELWEKPVEIEERMYCDVAIGASITGAARSVLLTGLHHAKRPIYCDTDAIVCEGLDMPLDRYALGAWDLEAEGSRVAIGGKKLYALFDGDEPVKWASKGARLDGYDIERIAKGEVIYHERDAPAFGLKAKVTASQDYLEGRAKFVSRKMQITVDEATEFWE
jgi:hypothetical protein